MTYKKKVVDPVRNVEEQALSTIHAKFMASVQGVVNDDGTACAECGATIWGGSDFEVAAAEHDEEECMVGANMVALYLIEHVTGNETKESRNIVRILKKNKLKKARL